LRIVVVSTWSDAGKRERLAQLWAEGWPAVRIGAALGVTRNAVIGAVHRLKLPLRRRKMKAAVVAPLVRKTVRVSRRAAWTPRPEATRLPPPAVVRAPQPRKRGRVLTKDELRVELEQALRNTADMQSSDNEDAP
jgi:hypothetical protein